MDIFATRARVNAAASGATELPIGRCGDRAWRLLKARWPCLGASVIDKALSGPSIHPPPDGAVWNLMIGRELSRMAGGSRDGNSSLGAIPIKFHFLLKASPYTRPVPTSPPRFQPHFRPPESFTQHHDRHNVQTSHCYLFPRSAHRHAHPDSQVYFPKSVPELPCLQDTSCATRRCEMVQRRQGDH